MNLSNRPIYACAVDPPKPLDLCETAQGPYRTTIYVGLCVSCCAFLVRCMYVACPLSSGHQSTNHPLVSCYIIELGNGRSSSSCTMQHSTLLLYFKINKKIKVYIITSILHFLQTCDLFDTLEKIDLKLSILVISSCLRLVCEDATLVTSLDEVER